MTDTELKYKTPEISELLGQRLTEVGISDYRQLQRATLYSQAINDLNDRLTNEVSDEELKRQAVTELNILTALLIKLFKGEVAMEKQNNMPKKNVRFSGSCFLENEGYLVYLDQMISGHRFGKDRPHNLPHTRISFTNIKAPDSSLTCGLYIASEKRQRPPSPWKILIDHGVTQTGHVEKPAIRPLSEAIMQLPIHAGIGYPFGVFSFLMSPTHEKLDLAHSSYTFFNNALRQIFERMVQTQHTSLPGGTSL